MPVSTSGVIGSAGRYDLPEPTGPRAADLVLAGRPLPLAGALRVYTCGITPYDVTHLGHAATFIWADVLVSVARALDVTTISSRNVTDVDDVLTAAATSHHRHYDELAVTQEFMFDRDMLALGIARPDVTPHARAHVSQVVQLVDALLRVDRAYQRGGTVFFRAPADLDRGGLGEQEALAAFAEFGDHTDDGRESPWDVPMWRPSGEEDPAWPSPWGWGRPAWHVECAAMATTVFGSSVDVLVGGADLVFPHHAYQAAMTEAATGVAPFARRQLHVGTVRYDGAKMAKSTGNLVLVRDLLAEVPGPVLRLLLLHRPWGEHWTYDPADLAPTADLLDRLRAAAAGRGGGGGVGGGGGGVGGGGAEGRDEVLAALAADLDVPAAVTIAERAGGGAARLLLDVLRLGRG